ncbi:FimV family protein [Chitinimonas sp. BJYL2]|uniref:type IV pilus assembly protein FimV n=1 Tax=Chitinimonas sp. BJYL2 TaxID=2976696 RepID=UPI0022B5E113|nr:hypothetical protein [Chitinimonas sp. BJYL2]
MARKTRTLQTVWFNPVYLAVLLTVAPHAATLGELQLRSRLGQALDARVIIQAQSEAMPRPDCISTTLYDGGEDGVPRRTAIELNPDKTGSATLMIYSEGALLEPISRLTVRLRCHGAEVRRDYTFLLDPPDSGQLTQALVPSVGTAISLPQSAIPAPPLEAKGPASVPANSLLGMARQHYPGQPDARRHFIRSARALNPNLPADSAAPLPDGYPFKAPPPLIARADPLGEAKGNWAVQPGDSLYSIVRNLYPDQPARKKALVAALRRLNPGLPRDGEKALPAGMLLLLPATLDITSSASPPVTPPTRTEPATVAPTADKLEISRTAVTQAAPSTDSTEAALNEREQALLDQASEQQAKLLEAQNRIEKLEKRLSWLSSAIDERDAAQKQVVRQAKPAWQELGIAVLGASLFTAAIMAWLGRRGRRRGSTEADRLAAAFTVPHRDPFGDEYATSSLQVDTVSRAPQPTEDNGLEGEPAPSPTRPHTSASSPQADNMDVFELNSAASEAAVLAAYGQVDRAIALLESEIERMPTSVINWMQLLEILYNHRETDRFLLVATDFHQRFASESMWDKVRRMGLELAPKAPVFATPPANMPFDGLGESPAEAAAPAPRAPSPQPLVFELDRSPTAIGEPENIDAIRLPHDVDFEIGTVEVPPLSELEYARQLIRRGEREAGAAILERILMEGSQDEKLAAADLLVRLTSPT